jgi:plastocyanin
MGRRHIVLVVAAAAGLGLVALGLLAPGPGSSVAGAEAPSSARVVVKATYLPPTVDIASGGTVVWSFEDGDTPHTVTADDNSFGSPPAGQKSGTFEHVFPQPGTVNYHCDFHPDMVGTVNVH